mgnify:CR=1 FL=1
MLCIQNRKGWTKLPKISVIMSTFNTKEEYLRSSIESILKQSFKDFEFIIIDDGSSEDDVEIIQSYKDERIILLKNKENCGLAKSLNKGLDNATGDYIFRMDSDDIAFGDRFKIQLDFMERHPEIDILGARAVCYGSNSCPAILDFGNDFYVKSVLFFTDLILHPTVVIRRSSVIKYNLRYDDKLRRAQDYDLWVRAAKFCKFEIIPDVVLRYRCHSQQATSIARESQLDVCKKVFLFYMNELNLTTNEQSVFIRNSLSGDTDNKLNISDIHEWVYEVLRTNKEEHLFNVSYFNERMISRLLISVALLLKNKKLQANLFQLVKIYNPYNIYFLIKHIARNIYFTTSFYNDVHVRKEIQ